MRKLVRKKYVEILERLFKITYLLLGIATFNSFLYDSSIQPVLVKVCFVLGVITLIGRLLFFKDYYKMPNWPLLMIFCVVFLLSMITNIKYGAFWEDFKWLVWTGLLFFMLYVCDTTRDKKKYEKEFAILSHILIIYTAIASLAGIWLMSNHYQMKWWSSSNELMQAGFRWGRLWGVYTDPNYGGIITVIAVLLSIYFLKTQKGWKKIIYIPIIAVDYLYIAFCDSRTAEVAMLLAGGFWMAYTAVQKRNVKRIFLYVLLAIVFAGGFIGETSVIKSWYNENFSTKGQTVGRVDEIQEDVSNGRLALWSSGIEIWKTRPILGTGYNSFLPYADKELPDSYAVNNPQGDYVSLHNEYLNILVYHGILGAGVFLIFIVRTIYLWLKNFWKIDPEDIDYIGVLSACCIAVAAAMLFLLEGLHTNSPGAFVLWTFLGYLMHYSFKTGSIKR